MTINVFENARDKKYPLSKAVKELYDYIISGNELFDDDAYNHKLKQNQELLVSEDYSSDKKTFSVNKSSITMLCKALRETDAIIASLFVISVCHNAFLGVSLKITKDQVEKFEDISKVALSIAPSLVPASNTFNF